MTYQKDVFHLERCTKREADLASVWRLRQPLWSAALGLQIGIDSNKDNVFNQINPVNHP
jgi:hypothetical protein